MSDADETIPASDDTLLPGGAATGPESGDDGASPWSETDRYALVREIGRGGNGRISVAMDRKLGRPIALKRPLDAHGAARLEREALVMAKLEHPGIVPVLDTGRDADGNPFFAMKLLGGPNLSERIRDAGSFDARLGLLRVVTAVADAIAYAHDRGVIHRDLKPHNVVVGEFGEVAVIDWGLAKTVGEVEDPATVVSTTTSGELTRDGEVVGTPAYMAPEQAMGAAVDPRTDVYAIGAMLYHLLAGRAPYTEASGATEVIARVLTNRAPAPLVEIAPDVAPELLAIVTKAMARAPSARYPSARELADDLHRYETGQLVAAHRYSLVTRARRWVRRHAARIAVGGGASVAVAAIALLVLQPSPAAAESPCQGIDAPVRAAWGPDARVAAARAFAASGVPYASAALHAVSSALDQRAERIASMRKDVCLARVIGAQSAQAADLRMQCLDQRVVELRAVAEQLGHADAFTVKVSDRLLGALGSVQDCTDDKRLRDVVPLPSEPVRRKEILAIDEALANIRAISLTGRDSEAEAMTPAAYGRALVAAHPPQLASATYTYASQLVDRGQEKAAVPLLHQAILAADRARTDRVRVMALTSLARFAVESDGSLDAAQAYADEAGAIADGEDDNFDQVLALHARSMVAGRRGKFEDAIELDRKSLELSRKEKDPISYAQALDALGTDYFRAGRLDDAERMFDEAATAFRHVYDTDDVPLMARVIQMKAVISLRRNRLSEAEDQLHRAIAIYDRTTAKDAMPRLYAESNLVVVLTAEERYDDARRLLEGFLPRVQKLGTGNNELYQNALCNLGDVLRLEGRLDAALVQYRTCLELRTKKETNAGDASRVRRDIARTLIAMGRFKDALTEADTALADLVRIRGPGGDDVAATLLAIGEARLALGDAAGARDALTRAQVSIDAADDPGDRGRLRYLLAQAQWQLGDKSSARRTATDARPFIEESPHKGKALAELDAWIAAHR